MDISLRGLAKSFDEKPILKELLDIDLESAEMVCHLEFVDNTYKIFYFSTKYLLYLNTCIDSGHRYMWANDFIEIIQILESELEESVLSIIEGSYEAGWWAMIPLWILTKPIYIESTRVRFFKQELMIKEDILNLKMPLNSEEYYLIEIWSEFINNLKH